MDEQREFQTAGLKVGGLHIGPAAVLTLLGFTAVVAQIVLMRELIVVFYGNEISLGLMLANWLLWTAAGSGLAGRLMSRLRNPRHGLASLQVLIAFTLPLSIYAVRSSRDYFQTVPGELLGPGPMFLTSLATLSLFCVISGCMFAAGSRLCAEEVGSSITTATGSVYLLEALGSGIGGVAASAALIPYLNAFQISLLLAFLNFVAAASLVMKAGLGRRVAVVAVASVFAILSVLVPRLERASLEKLWKGFRLVDVKNSRYGNLVVVDTEGTRSLYENGLVVATVPDPAAAEEAVHFALLEHPEPQSLLLIGGGINGSLKQALQHPSLERVDYVELDPAILDLAGRHFASEWASARADRRVKTHHLDGRLFVKTTSSTFDVIIVNLPDPQTAQLNRFYTREFYQEASRRLAPGGIVSFQVTAAENYISPPLGEFLRCVHKTLREVFTDVAAIPGETVHFLAAARSGSLAPDPGVLVERLQARQLQTLYVREYFLPFRMSAGRMLDLQQQIEPTPETPVNRDFAPIAYYFDVALWSSRFHAGSARWFEVLARVNFATLLGGVTASLTILTVLALGLLWLRYHNHTLAGSRNRMRLAAGACVAGMGFNVMGLEILILLGFQAIYGYVYHQLAILIAAVMVGMALGAWMALRKGLPAGHEGSGAASPESLQPVLRAVALLQFSAALAPILLYAILRSLTHISTETGLWMASQIVFPIMALVCGLLGGYQFPLASRVYFADSGARSLGVPYALDLAGASAGAVVLSLYWFPVYGFLRSALLMAVVNLAPAVLAALPVAREEANRD
jgi:spermidine synthase